MCANYIQTEKLKNWTIWILMGFFSITSTMIWSQEPLTITELEQEYHKADEFLQSFKNDEAIALLSKLEQNLQDQNLSNSHLGLMIQSRYAEALEKDHQDELAIFKLLEVADAGLAQKDWEVYCNTQLSLARLKEKIGRPEQCYVHLNLARNTINKHQVSQLYPRFAIRISSYHRLFGDIDSSLFYAKEALRTAPVLGLNDDEATAHLLMGLLVWNKDYKEAATHFEKAATTWSRTKDYSGFCYTQLNLSRLYFENGETNLALLYNTKSISAAKKAIEMGHEEIGAIYISYQRRGKILKELGKLDSAWYYTTKGHEMEIEDVYKTNNDRIIEIDAKYNLHKRDQSLILEKEKSSNFQQLFFVILASLGLLTFFYLRLLRANRKNIRKNQTIKKINTELQSSLEKQILLQSELNHRVKNNLQIIIGLLDLQAEEFTDKKMLASLESMSQRIQSMSVLHEVLNQSITDKQLPVVDYIEKICHNFSSVVGGQNKPNITFDIVPTYFNLDTLMPIGMMLHELLTNSNKYFNNHKDQLAIQIKLKPDGDYFYLSYHDNGPGFPKGGLNETEGRIGSYLLGSMIRQLNGHWSSKNDNGAFLEFYFKIKNVGDG